MTDRIALGVKVFKRTAKLRQLLDSITHHPIETVYVADDGESTQEKRELINSYQNKSYDLVHINLEYDAGLGYGRNRIVEEFDEDFLIIVDSDHRLPDNLLALYDQLCERHDFGGIAGLLLEYGNVTGACHDLFDRDNLLLRHVSEKKPIQRVAGHPFIEFDFIPNAAIFRRECLEDYSWDPEYVIGKEHLDFYVGHMNTDWRFAINPSVVFDHNPGGDEDFEANRTDHQKHKRSKRYFLNKWGYRQVVFGWTHETDWYSLPKTDATTIAEYIYKNFVLNAPPSIQARVMDMRDRFRRYKGRPPL